MSADQSSASNTQGSPLKTGFQSSGRPFNSGPADDASYATMLRELVELQKYGKDTMVIEPEGEPHHHPNNRSIATELRHTDYDGTSIKERYVFAFENGQTQVHGTVEQNQPTKNNSPFHTDVSRQHFSSEWLSSPKSALEALHRRSFNYLSKDPSKQLVKPSLIGARMDAKVILLLDASPGGL